MKQFDICVNLHGPSAKRAPYYAILQSDLLEPFELRLTAPLIFPRIIKPVRKLTLEVQVGSETYLLSMLELASVRTQIIGRAVGSVRDRHSEIVAALDLLIMGV